MTIVKYFHLPNYSLARCTTVYVEECPEPVPDTLEVCLDVTESECVSEDQEVSTNIRYILMIVEINSRTIIIDIMCL